ncbi:unnamed protein product [Lupinus luteus]|uniref:Uncharacterized protein n=1 Tax=Lupinus luteus TaxID=3873 RepID=A0AAV1XTQ2_LUPLU
MGGSLRILGFTSKDHCCWEPSYDGWGHNIPNELDNTPSFTTGLTSNISLPV